MVLQLFCIGSDFRTRADIPGRTHHGPCDRSMGGLFGVLGLCDTVGDCCRNLTRGSLGRKWMAIRDMDIAAEIIGVNPLGAKLSAFAISSFLSVCRGIVLCGLPWRR